MCSNSSRSVDRTKFKIESVDNTTNPKTARLGEDSILLQDQTHTSRHEISLMEQSVQARKKQVSIHIQENERDEVDDEVDKRFHSTLERHDVKISKEEARDKVKQFYTTKKFNKEALLRRRTTKFFDH